MRKVFYRISLVLFICFSLTALSSGIYIYIRLIKVRSEIPVTTVNQYSNLSATESVLTTLSKALEIYGISREQGRVDDLSIALNRTKASLTIIKSEYGNNLPKELFPLIREIHLLADSIEELLKEEVFSYTNTILLNNRLNYVVTEFQSYVVRINNDSIISLDEQIAKVEILRKFMFFMLFVTLFSIGTMTYLIVFQKKLIKIVSKSKLEAVKASKSKSAFLANMSHEIRTPLNAVIGMLHLLNRTTLSSKQQDYSNKAFTSAKTLLSIINDILDFSKIEAGQLEIEQTDFNLNDLLKELGNMLFSKASEKSIELVFEYPRDIPVNLIGDSLRLKQVLLNLVNNAIKFTDKGEVLISVEEESQTDDDVILLFRVKDSGIGLKEEQVKKLFQPFSQADTSISRTHGGTGLGLSISNNLVEQMGGKITVESIYKVGSQFSFTIRFKKSPDNLIRDDYLVPVFLNKINILIIDDNRIARNAITDYLKEFKLLTENVSSGKEAIKLIKNRKKMNQQEFDLFIVDYKMDEMNGFDTVKAIKEMPHVNDQKFIIITAYPKDEIVSKADEELFHAFLIKPIIPSVLFDTILEVFNCTDSGLTERKPVVEEPKQLMDANILLVEDNEINQQVATELLEWVGYTVDIASNGQDAINIIKGNQPNIPYDAILMDLHMPEIDGFEATKIIRSIIKNDTFPIIALTADAVSEVKEQVLNSNMNDYITKPINPDDLYDTLDKWLGDKFRIGKKGIEVIEHNYSIPGLNMEQGLSRLHGNKNLYKNIIEKFYNNHKNDMHILKELNSNKDWESSHRLVHTLKGVAGSLGAQELYTESKVLEEILLKHKNNEFEESYNALCSIFTPLISSIEQFINSSKNIKSETITVNRIEEKEYLENLKELAKYIKNQQPRECFIIIEKLTDNLKDSDEKEGIVKVKDLLDKYKFQEAGEYITQNLL